MFASVPPGKRIALSYNNGGCRTAQDGCNFFPTSIFFFTMEGKSGSTRKVRSVPPRLLRIFLLKHDHLNILLGAMPLAVVPPFVVVVSFDHTTAFVVTFKQNGVRCIVAQGI
mmetsp:Transcript_15254/g.44267  ORF Transcript_15254/g.44267 Transcript_15254/m.44267 type:complete len:112 (+) Transcript_15254:200-535(+)